jgi:hypothetical protein
MFYNLLLDFDSMTNMQKAVFCILVFFFPIFQFFRNLPNYWKACVKLMIAAAFGSVIFQFIFPDFKSKSSILFSYLHWIAVIGLIVVEWKLIVITIKTIRNGDKPFSEIGISDDTPFLIKYIAKKEADLYRMIIRMIKKIGLIFAKK